MFDDGDSLADSTADDDFLPGSPFQTVLRDQVYLTPTRKRPEKRVEKSSKKKGDAWVMGSMNSFDRTRIVEDQDETLPLGSPSADDFRPGVIEPIAKNSRSRRRSSVSRSSKQAAESLAEAVAHPRDGNNGRSADTGSRDSSGRAKNASIITLSNSASIPTPPPSANSRNDPATVGSTAAASKLQFKPRSRSGSVRGSNASSTGAPSTNAAVVPPPAPTTCHTPEKRRSLVPATIQPASPVPEKLKKSAKLPVKGRNGHGATANRTSEPSAAASRTASHDDGYTGLTSLPRINLNKAPTVQPTIRGRVHSLLHQRAPEQPVAPPPAVPSPRPNQPAVPLERPLREITKTKSAPPTNTASRTAGARPAAPYTSHSADTTQVHEVSVPSSTRPRLSSTAAPLSHSDMAPGRSTTHDMNGVPHQPPPRPTRGGGWAADALPQVKESLQSSPALARVSRRESDALSSVGLPEGTEKRGSREEGEPGNHVGGDTSDGSSGGRHRSRRQRQSSHPMFPLEGAVPEIPPGMDATDGAAGKALAAEVVTNRSATTTESVTATTSSSTADRGSALPSAHLSQRERTSVGAQPSGSLTSPFYPGSVFGMRSSNSRTGSAQSRRTSHLSPGCGSQASPTSSAPVDGSGRRKSRREFLVSNEDNSLATSPATTASLATSPGSISNPARLSPGRGGTLSPTAAATTKKPSPRATYTPPKAVSVAATTTRSGGNQRKTSRHIPAAPTQSAPSVRAVPQPPQTTERRTTKEPAARKPEDRQQPTESSKRRSSTPTSRSSSRRQTPHLGSFDFPYPESGADNTGTRGPVKLPSGTHHSPKPPHMISFKGFHLDPPTDSSASGGSADRVVDVSKYLQGSFENTVRPGDYGEWTPVTLKTPPTVNANAADEVAASTGSTPLIARGNSTNRTGGGGEGAKRSSTTANPAPTSRNNRKA